MTSATQRAHLRPIHPFPARMAPSIVWDSLPDGSRQISMLDPMSGSGTALVCARAKGHQAIGYDTDPLALIISKAWCADLAPEALRRRAALVLERAKEIADLSDYADSYPRTADEESRKFIDFWFDAENRRQLTALSRCIGRVRSKAERTSLWCAFSRLIITKAVGTSLAMDVSHSRPHKTYNTAPIRPWDKFLHSVCQVVDRSPFRWGATKSPAAYIQNGDSRCLPVESQSIDMIITSPPYLNAIDYIRGHKFSLVWMGHTISELRKIRSSNIGSENPAFSDDSAIVLKAVEGMGNLDGLDSRRVRMVQRFASDMNKVLKESARVLKPGARAIYVVGNSAIRGVYINNSEGLTTLAEAHGLSLVSKVKRPIDGNRRYLPPPGSKKAGRKLQGRMREEVILTFRN